MLRLIAFLFAFALASGMILAQSRIGSENYSSQYANSLITNVSNYIASVNQSSYLIFSPNLTGAYLNLSYAMSNLSYNPSAAVLYAERANSSAYMQFRSMEYYKTASFPVMFAFTLVMLLLLYKFMIPLKKKRRR